MVVNKQSKAEECTAPSVAVHPADTNGVLGCRMVKIEDKNGQFKQSERTHAHDLELED